MREMHALDCPFVECLLENLCDENSAMRSLRGASSEDRGRRDAIETSGSREAKTSLV